MSDIGHRESSFARFGSVKRKALRISQEELVKKSYLESGGELPVVFEPVDESINLISWIKNNRALVEAELLRHGAILFRNFRVNSAARFEQVIEAVSGELLEYNERTSPRSQVSGNVYTSTDYPPDKRIFPHNEQSYNLTFLLKIFFCCIKAAEQGGETPIGDCRKIYKKLDPRIRERFIEKKYAYVRNFREGFGLSWRTAFQTEDKSVVEAYCRRNEIEFEWRAGNGLRTRQIREAVARHPRTGELSWFNHLTFFNVSTLDQDIQELLFSQFDTEDLPNNTYYGDGTPIEPDVMEELRAAYLSEKVIFPWQEGDVLMLDNMLTSHAREAFVGPRKVIVGMAEPFSWKDIQLNLSEV
jgi:alpha-ketoglutarate-dependent taurine dioxygenase